MPQAQSVALPKRLPLIVQAANRDDTTAKDAKLINCYAEKTEEGYTIIKRFGTVVQSSAVNGEAGRGLLPFGSIDTLPVPRVQPPVATDAGSGQIHIWGFITHIPFRTWAVVATLQGGSAINLTYGEIPATPSQGAIYIFGWGTTAYVVSPSTGGAYVPVTDANYPISTVPGFVYLDGTTYVMGATGEIFGSLNLNDPTHWDPLNVIFAQSRPDLPVCLAQQLTYVVAIKSTSTQFFYDAGNPTGSPLSPVPGALVNYGCISADTVQSIDDLLLWVTSNIDATPQVLMLKNLQPTIISTPAIERLLELGNATDQYTSFSFKLAGHKFYGFSNLQANITLVFDITEGLWYQWTDAAGNYYPVMSVQVSVPFSVAPQSVPASLCVQMRNDGRTYILSPNYVTTNDNGTVFNMEIVTPNFDAGTDRGKQMNVMWVGTDQLKGNKLRMRTSDDDYQRWTNWRTFDLSRKKPMLTGLGTFTKRAFHFKHDVDMPFRCRAIGLQMDICTL